MKTENGTSGFWRSVAALLWIVIVLVAYYAVHKPLTAPQVRALAFAVARWGVAGVLVILAGALGEKIFPKAGFSPIVLAVVEASVGFGIWGLFWLVVGACGGFRVWVFWLSLILGCVLLWRECANWISRWRSLVDLVQDGGLWGKFVAFLAATMLFASSLNALAPPIKFDALTYHFVLPWHYLHAGRFFAPQGSLLWGMPQQAEMLYTWAYGLLGVETAAVLGWWVALLTLVGILALASEWVATRSAWAAVAALLVGFTWWDSASWGYADQWAALFGFAVLPVMVAWRRSKGTPRLLWAFWAGLLGGFAAGTKYTALVLPFLFFLWLGWNSLHTSERKPWLSLFLFLGAVLLAFAPWLLKNWLATHSLLYPFTLRFSSAAANRLYPPNEHQPWYAVAFLPLFATWLGKEGGIGYSASIGAWLLALSPWAFLLRKRYAEIDLVAWMALGGVALWGGVTLVNAHAGQTRLYFVFFPSFALLAALGTEALFRLRLGEVRLKSVVQVLLGFSLLLAAWQAAVVTLDRGSPKTVVGLTSPDLYLDHNLGWYAVAMRFVKGLPPSERVMMLWEPRSFYCLPRCVPDEVIDRFWHDRRTYKSAEAMILAWKSQGYTSVLFYRGGAEFVRKHDKAYLPQDWATLDVVLSHLQLRKNFGEAYLLYEIP